MNSKVKFKVIAFWLIIGAVIGWQGSKITNGKLSIPNTNTQEEKADISLFWSVWEALNQSYIDSSRLNSQNQVYGAISGMVSALGDPYTVFMTPTETNAFHKSLEGALEGIGAELTVKEERLTVVSPLKGSPAEKAGLEPGDFVYMVDGKTTSDMTLFEAITTIRGEKGTTVELTIIRAGVNEPIILKITRDTVNVPSLESEFVEHDGKNIQIISIYQFGDNTLEAFSEAVRNALLERPDGIILDMRENGGGYLDVSVNVLSEFLSEEEKAVIVKKKNSGNEVLYTSGNGKLADIKMVVLVDEGSASASEIVAGALQDYKRAVLIGEKTFGKGSVQELSTLEDGSSLRMTIAKWYTPNDRSIDETGIEPDIKIEADSSEIGTENDSQMQEALNYLSKL